MVSDRWAHLAPAHVPCTCHTMAERCVCAASCLNHPDFHSPWPPPVRWQVWSSWRGDYLNAVVVDDAAAPTLSFKHPGDPA